MRAGTQPVPVSQPAEAVPKGRRLALADGGSLPNGASRNIGETLQRAAAAFPTHGIIYVESDGSDRFQSYPELATEADCIMGGLQSIGVQPGQIVLFQLSNTRNFLASFWGCVFGGFIPAPLALPTSYERPNGALLKFKNSADLVGRAVILADSETAPSIQGWIAAERQEQLRLAICESLKQSPPAGARHKADSEETALLMLTSGSTGIPKGVPLTHANLISRSVGSVLLNGFTSEDVALNWMPLDHVAGLIYFHLRDVFLGCTEIQVPTNYILHDPLRWLECIDRFRATITFAPNFAYALVNEREREIALRRWDLSSMHWILNGAEAIVARTARKFLQLLVPHGLPPDAMRPAWGMSETSSGVTYGDRFLLETTTDEDPFVEVGRPIPGFCMRIVDEHGDIVEEGTIGQLQVKGSTVMHRYYKNTELNESSFTADGWFKTGDLGLIKDGRLTITGREKDVIIINSINYYSHEIEGVVEQLPGVEPSYTAACGVRGRNNAEKLAIFFTPAAADEHDWPALIQDIRRQVLQRIGINPDFILPVEKGRIPKTEIGKIKRSELKAAFEASAFKDVCDRWSKSLADGKPPRNEVEAQIVRFWEEVMQISQIGIDQNFFEMGGDSLQAARILCRLNEAFRLELTLRDFFQEAQTVEALADRVLHSCSHAAAKLDAIPRFDRSQPIPLSYPQQRIWFLDQMAPDSGLYNIPILLRVSGNINETALRQSLRDLAERHEVLRTSFPMLELGPRQLIQPTAELDVEVLDFVGSPEAAVARKVLELANEPLDLLNGPVWRCWLIRFSEREVLLLLIFHQIAIDGCSLEILFRELKEGYLASLGQPDTRQALPIQYADFASWQRGASIHLEKSLEYWLSQLAPPLAPLDLKPDLPAPSPGYDGAVVSKMLKQEAVETLLSWTRREAVSPFTAFLSLFFIVLRHRTRQSDIRLGTAVSGRQRMEIERLIGFFVNTLVLRLRLDGNPSFRQVLRNVRDVVLAAHAHQDVPYERVFTEVQKGATGGSRQQLLQVWFGLQDPMRPFLAGDVRFEPSKVDLPVTQFELSLFIREENRRFSAILEYNTSLFSEETVKRLLSHYEALLSYGSKMPDADLDTMLRLLEQVDPSPPALVEEQEPAFTVSPAVSR